MFFTWRSGEHIIKLQKDYDLKITKSGINHRFIKIKELAESILEKERH